MQSYKAPLEEMKFLWEVFDYNRIQELEAYQEFDLETAISVIETHAKFCTEQLLPLNEVGDKEGIHYDPKTHSVTMPEGFKDLYEQFVETGMTALVHPEEYGGSNAPEMLSMFVEEMTTATNKSFSMCPLLTRGLIAAVHHYGSQEVREMFLPNLVSGEWTGTMCLTEPHSGTDLGLLTTKAIPNEDGTYNLTGTKIWITYGDHDMTENIVHLVLARLPDAPAGIKGISLFVVPKITPDDEPNPIYCSGVEHKMGIHASPTCVMSLEEAKGWMVGEPNKGMRAMFTMMNHARLSVSLEGVALSEIAYQNARDFALERRQSRSLDPAKRDKNAAADLIIVHPDVRRMLLNIKASNEGMRALACWTAHHIDLSQAHSDEKVRKAGKDIEALLTPILKSFLTERGFNNINSAIQSTGGAGYTVDLGLEQFMRDERIALIYEGTNHVQALDLVGRKLTIEKGRLFLVFNEYISQFIKENKDDERMNEFIEPLKRYSKKLTETTMSLATKAMKDPEMLGAIASNYLNLFAYVALSYVWGRQVKFALDKEGKFYKTKIKTARYFFHNILPEADSYISLIEAGKDQMMAFEEDEF